MRRCLALFHRSTGIATSGGVATVFLDAADFAALLFKVLSVPSVLALDALSFIASAPLLRALHTALTGARGGTTGGGHQQHHLPPVANAGGALAGALGVRSAVLVAAAFAALSVAIGWLSPLRREAASGALHSTA